jgi:hypothetical protein
VIHARPIRRLEPLPRPLWNDRHHAPPERESFRLVRCHDVQHRGAVDDLGDFVAVRVALLGAFAGKFAREDGAVTVGRQSCEGPLPLGCERLRGYPQLSSDWPSHDGEHLFLRWAMTLA